MISSDPDPPYIKDGELVVECETSGCGRKTTVGTDVDSTVSTADTDTWRVSFIPTADGRLEVDEVECPEHRIEDEIDALAEEQQNLSKSQSKMGKMIDKFG